MADESTSRRGGGSKLSRSQTVTIRLDPRLRYLAELAARKQRRTLSSFVEWAIEESLGRVKLREGGDHIDDYGTSVAQDAEALWDVDEADRFAKLALRYPDLLTHDEQILWKLIRENGAVWSGSYPNGDFVWKLEPRSLRFEVLREHWGSFNAVARGEAAASTLPSWIKKQQKKDSDVPF